MLILIWNQIHIHTTSTKFARIVTVAINGFLKEQNSEMIYEPKDKASFSDQLLFVVRPSVCLSYPIHENEQQYYNLLHYYVKDSVHSALVKP